ncbi:alpha/beta hydrolase [Jiella endophytica]|uniref:Alpha/beta hydrolase n=1 Tax=Jiella endophytica TaxID=2558362 RepID=A0A4Y8RUH8_9HYPH|nr:alpha/beta hydrolase [Jiella endophytica]TFF27578.1 alpha/beta hydrolase [Jiella endophytica]
MIDRRSLLLQSAATLFVPVARAEPRIDRIALWPGKPPGGGGPTGPEDVSRKGAVSNISQPRLDRVLPERPNGAAILIAAGGGYKRISIGNEGFPAARWLAARGITAYILTYRLPGEGWDVGPLAPLQDAQRAIRVIRAGAMATGIDPERLGVLGFSAGGHLLGMAAAWSGENSYPAVDAADELSARPDAAALIYPVITLEPPYDRTATRRSLVGDNPSQAARDLWSVDSHVRRGCPPMFLLQAADDPIVDPANATIMAEACRAAGIPAELHLLPGGGHGFGMGRAGTPSANWADGMTGWLRRNRLIA